MNKNQLDFLKQSEALFLDHFAYYIENFATELCSKIVFDSNELCWIELELFNGKTNKIIKFVCSKGVNVDNDQFYGLRLFVEFNLAKNARTSFSIKDYCASKEVNYTLTDFIFNESEVEFFNKMNAYLNDVIDILNTEEIQTIIFTDYWIDVDPDFTPYR